ncbi:ATP-binding cassette domain-containing protein [Paracoccus sp. p4-l81]|uniref:ATP-binding cassette domain-containing protein n=1 Tax=Paracoccus sp. p4-l81 TaxID=3342806 RepID=UPI0035B97E87
MILEIAGKSFGSRAILGPIRLALDLGERVAVLGPSGIGKSTLMRIVAGLDPAFPAPAARTAMVFQEPNLLTWRDSLANLVLTTGCTADEARGWLAATGLSGHEGHVPRQLSLGQQRRLALARAFAARPDLLLMDEPFASLDRETAGRMLALTDDLLTRTGAGLLLITHDPAEADTLRARRTRLTGSPAVLVDDQKV